MSQGRDSKGRFLSKSGKQKTQTTTHSLRGPDGKFISTSSRKPSKKVKPAPVAATPERVTHVALVIDASGSMSSIKGAAMQALNAQLATVKAEAFRRKEKTLVSVYTFEGSRTQCLGFEQFPESVRPLTDDTYRLGGMTPLCDAVGTACADLETVKGAQDENHSFLLLVVTDGGENSSTKYKNSIGGTIRRLQGTDRWTITFSAPRGATREIVHHFGVHEGNVQEWDQTVRGVQDMATNTSQGTSQYYAARSAGAKSTQKFFTNLDKITKTDLRVLTDLSDKFKEWTVAKETSITEFVDEKLGAGQYRPGNAFYELMKPEKVQSYKRIIIKEKTTGKVYGGNEVRKLIGLPDGQDCKVEPGNHSNYKVFVESTSSNRKLVRGTNVLYSKS